MNPTVYKIDEATLWLSAIGDFFAWLIVGLVIAAIVLAIARSRES